MQLRLSKDSYIIDPQAKVLGHVPLVHALESLGQSCVPIAHRRDGEREAFFGIPLLRELFHDHVGPVRVRIRIHAPLSIYTGTNSGLCQNWQYTSHWAPARARRPLPTDQN